MRGSMACTRLWSKNALSNWLLGDQLLGALWTSCLAALVMVAQIFLSHVSRTSDQLLAEKLRPVDFPRNHLHSLLCLRRSLIAVHDLMHRYESHFPEVGEKGEYRRRER